MAALSPLPGILVAGRRQHAFTHFTMTGQFVWHQINSQSAVGPLTVSPDTEMDQGSAAETSWKHC